MKEIKENDINLINRKLDNILCLLTGDDLHPTGLISEHEKIKIEVQVLKEIQGLEKNKVDLLKYEVNNNTKKINAVNKTVWGISGGITVFIIFIKFLLPLLLK